MPPTSGSAARAPKPQCTTEPQAQRQQRSLPCKKENSSTLQRSQNSIAFSILLYACFLSCKIASLHSPTADRFHLPWLCISSTWVRVGRAGPMVRASTLCEGRSASRREAVQKQSIIRTGAQRIHVQAESQLLCGCTYRRTFGGIRATRKTGSLSLPAQGQCL